jgi:hypothetical protein
MATTSIPVPSISTHGWVKDPGQKLDRLLAYFFTSRHNQDRLFLGKVSSMQRILAENSYVPAQCVTDVQIKLTEFLKGYFSSVNVTCTVVEPDTYQGSSNTLSILVEFSDSGETRLGGYQFNTSNSSFQKVAQVLNSAG